MFEHIFARSGVSSAAEWPPWARAIRYPLPLIIAELTAPSHASYKECPKAA